MLIGNCNYCKKQFRKREKKYKFCSLKCANNFNLNGLKQVKLPEKSTQLAEFVGIILGDGDITRYQVGITLNTKVDRDYAIFVGKLFASLFPDVDPFFKVRKEYGCTIVGVSSRIITDYLHDMGLASWKPLVPKWILEQEKYIASCIRGLIDTEGCVGFKVYNGRNKNNIYRQLTFTNRNTVLLQFVRDGLNKLGFKCTQSLIKNIYLSNDLEIDRYRNTIGFHNPKLEERSLIRNYLDYCIWRGV